MAESLRVEIRTPHELVFAASVVALRVPSGTGLVGLRPRGEPLVLAVEPGLIVLRLSGPATPDADDDDTLRFAVTTGGLLEADRERCSVFTPFAAVSDSEQEVLAALEQIQATPSSEILARRRLAELERRILSELRESPGPGPVRRSHG